jgi:hypothetical protein
MFRSVLKRTPLTTLMLLAASPAAVASTPVPAELLRELASPDAETRERAQEQIVGRADLKLKDLDALILDGTLSPEAYFRCVGAARPKFESSPRGAMGVSFSLERRGLNIVQSAMEGFPSVKVLRPGDRIVEIDGWQPDPYRSDFMSGGSARPFIISRDPGDVIPLKIIRDGQEVQVDLELGKFSDLKNTNPLSDSELKAAWDVRRGRYQKSLPVINGPATEESGLESADLHDQQIGLDAVNGQVTPAAGGGQSRTGRTLDDLNERLASRPTRNLRDGFDPGLNRQVMIRAGEVIVNGRRVRNGEMIGGARVVIDPMGRQLDQRIDEMRRNEVEQRMALIRSQIVEMDTKLKNEPMSPQEREGVQNLREALQRMLDQAREERKALDRRGPAQP